MTELRTRISDALSTLAIAMAQREMTFETVVATPTAQERAAPTTRARRVLRALTSERFAKDLGLIRRPLARVLTALFMVSLIGWTAEPMASSLQLAVNNLRVNVLQGEAARELETELSAAKDARVEPSPADTARGSSAVIQTTTRVLARAAARELVRTEIIDRLANVQRTALSEAEFVRASIVEQQIDLPPRADPVARVRHDVAQSMASDADSARMARIQAHLEGQLRPHAEQLHQANPNLFARMGATLEARYASSPVSPLDAQGKLIARMVDEALGGLDVHPTSELGKQGQKLVKEFGKEAVKTWVDAHAKTYTTDAIIEAARAEVTARTRPTFRFESSSEARQFARDLRAAEGTWGGSAAARDEARVARAVASKVAAHPANSGTAAEVIAERLGGYDHLFPSSGGAGGGVGGGGPHAKVTAHAQASGRVFAQARATNFRTAARSFRVRGVLIGQDQSVRGLDLRDIRWTVRSESATGPVRVDLAVQAGPQWVGIGTFDGAVVNQALRYAADRRVVATTITPGDGKLIRRVTYLHPVLVDTPLGCRVVEADRFVDTFSFASSRSPGGSPLARLAADREQVGQWMTAVRLAEAVAARPSHGTCPLSDIERVARGAGLQPVRFSSGVGDAIERFLTDQERKQPGTTTFLRNAHACATSRSESLAACLCARVKPGGRGEQYWFPEDHTSQFRERETTLGPDLQWLKRSRDHLAHIDLWVHTTFALRRSGAGDEEARADEATAVAVDFPGDHLAPLRRVIGENLPQYLAANLRSPTYDDFMMPLEDFVLLQRFMRAALAGTLGRGFPVTKLIDLERATRQLVPYQPTIRWEATAPAQLSLAATLSDADPRAAKMYRAWEADRDDRLTSQKPVCGRASN